MEKLFSLPLSHQVTKMNLNKIIFLYVFVSLWQFSPARPPHSARQEGGLIRIGVLKVESPLENNDLKVKHNLPKPVLFESMKAFWDGEKVQAGSLRCYTISLYLGTPYMLNCFNKFQYIQIQ
jgi:hypothetical protein